MPYVFNPPAEKGDSFLEGIASASDLLKSITDRQKQNELIKAYQIANQYAPAEEERKAKKEQIELNFLPQSQQAELANIASQIAERAASTKSYEIANQYAPGEAQRKAQLEQLQLSTLPQQLQQAAITQNTKVLAKPLADAQSIAQQAAEQKSLLQQFSKAYDESDITGPVAKYLPALTGANQRADQLSNTLAANIAKTLGGSRASVYGLKFAVGLKPSREFTKQAKEEAVSGLSASLDRAQEYADFFAKGAAQGLSQGIINHLWDAYNTQYPEYNPDTKKAEFSRESDRFLQPAIIRQAQTSSKIPLVASKEDLKKLSKEQRAALLLSIGAQ